MEVLIAGAFMAALAMAITKLSVLGQKSAKTVDSSYQLSQIVQEINQTLSKSENCLATAGGLYGRSLDAIKKNIGGTFQETYKRGAVYADNSLILRDLKTQQRINGEHELLIRFERTASVDGARDIVKFVPLEVTMSNNNVVDCSSSSLLGKRVKIFKKPDGSITTSSAILTYKTSSITVTNYGMPVKAGDYLGTPPKELAACPPGYTEKAVKQTDSVIVQKSISFEVYRECESKPEPFGEMTIQN